MLLKDINSCHTVSLNGSSGKHMYSGILLKCLPCHWDCTAFPLLHSYASMHCITVLLQSFYWFVLLYVYSYSSNSTVYVTHVNRIVLRILYTHACCDHRVAWGAKVKHLRQLAIVGPVSWCWIICTLLETMLDYAVTLGLAVSGTRRPEIIWRVRRQQWLLISLLFLCVTTNY